jgi:uncharacterized protein YecA (UPF0149 family)
MAVLDVDDVPEPDDGVVDGVVDGVESPPMFGQLLDECAAAFASMTAAGSVEVDFAESEELVAAWATAPPASSPETAKVAMTCLERLTIPFTSFPWVCRSSQAPLCKASMCARPE